MLKSIFLLVAVFYKTVYEALEKVEQTQKKDKYNDAVIDLLEKKKQVIHNEKNKRKKDQLLMELQKEIEDLTMDFDEDSIFKTSYDIMKMLIIPNEVNARDYLKINKKLSNQDEELLNEFSQYTIEGLIVHLLGQLFRDSEGSLIVRTATLIENLDLIVRRQAYFLKRRRCQVTKKSIQNQANDESHYDEYHYEESIQNQANDESHSSNKKSINEKNEEKLVIGLGLVELLKNRCLIDFSYDRHGNVKVKDNVYYSAFAHYSFCLFDIKLLPMKLHLPMVYKPTYQWYTNLLNGQ